MKKTEFVTFDAGLYERLALSRDKDSIRELARKGQHISQPQDPLKQPYVLEFLGSAAVWVCTSLRGST